MQSNGIENENDGEIRMLCNQFVHISFFLFFFFSLSVESRKDNIHPYVSVYNFMNFFIFCSFSTLKIRLFVVISLGFVRLRKYSDFSQTILNSSFHIFRFLNIIVVVYLYFNFFFCRVFGLQSHFTSISYFISQQKFNTNSISE